MTSRRRQAIINRSEAKYFTKGRGGEGEEGREGTKGGREGTRGRGEGEVRVG